jgi:putative addiction module CopG family antidote
MNISLTPKPEGFVKAKVKTGDHNNASEVIREALRVLQA